jgi:N-acetylmuramoyl-L-alanine amidase
VLKISKFLKTELEATEQFEITLTREDDRYLKLRERGRIAVNAGVDFFISEHTNAYRGTARGTEVFYSVDLPEDQKWADELSKEISSLFGVSNRGGKTRLSEISEDEDYYTVIDTAQDGGIPHVFLVESLFHDNVDDEKLLLNDDNLKLIAMAQAMVVCRMFDVPYVRDPLSHWAEKAWKELNDKGINIYEKRFDDPITRGEIFALLNRMIDKD